MSVMKNKPSVVFIVVGWNNHDLLRECFASIENQTYSNIKTIYVDNNSQDQSCDLVKRELSDVVVIENDENEGFARGNNIGINLALEDPSVDYICLLNTDARLEDDWIEKIVNFAGLKPKGAFFQGTTLDYFDHNVIDSTHIFMARNGQATQGNWRKKYQKELGPRKAFGVNAAACMISRHFIDSQPFKNELFDETMFMYLEDVDVAARATIMGWDNYLVPDARAYHMGSASSSKNPSFSLYLTFRNNAAVIFKNFPLKITLRLLMKMPRSDFDSWRTLRRRGDKKAAQALLKGRVVGIFRLPLFWGKTMKLRKYRKVDSSYLWHLMRDGY